MENVASTDHSDEELVGLSFGCNAWYVDAPGISLAHRPRLYWID